MATVGGTASAVDFWESVSQTFAHNNHVFYELYNEPHIDDMDAYINGN